MLGRLGAPRNGATLPRFRSGDELVAKTPGFYENAMRRLDVQLGECHQYAARHFGGENLYLNALRKNVQHAGSDCPKLRRRPPYTLLPEVEPYPRDLVSIQ